MNIQNFINEKFGSIRVIIEDGTEWFVARDVAKCLGYKKTRNAIQDHVDDEYKKIINLNTALNRGPIQGNPNTILINEAGVYQLIFSSKLPDAKEFQKWVFEEVLPSIRNVGGYLDLDRKEIRDLTKEAQTDLTDRISELQAQCCDWMSIEQMNYLIRALASAANNMAGIETGERNKATSQQLIMLMRILHSFGKTISKRIKRCRVKDKKFKLSDFVYKCKAKANESLINSGYQVNDIYITTEW